MKPRRIFSSKWPKNPKLLLAKLRNICCEDVAAEAFRGHFLVQGMRDGNVYMSELPKRNKNKPIFREDNSSFSHGKDKKYYFFFSLDEDQLDLLPEKLVNQASAIAQKVIRELMKGRGYRQ